MRSVAPLACAVILASMSGAESEPLLDRFAVCTGRLSAELESQWLFSDPRADATEALRDTMRDLYHSVSTSESEAPGLAKLLDAKVAHARLLTQAHFSRDAAVRTLSRRRADNQVALCASLLLS